MDTTCSVNGQRQTATLNCEISTNWETKPRTTPQKLLDSYWYRNSSRGPKPCKLYDYDEADEDHVGVCEFYALWM